VKGVTSIMALAGITENPAQLAQKFGLDSL
jgi:hypothetical protein